MRKRHTAPGQVLLTSLLVLGFLTLGFVLLGAMTMNEERQSNQALESKAMAAAAATACIEQALNRLGNNASYAGNETLSISTQSCTIRPIIVGGGTWTIETWAQVGIQYVYFRVILTKISPIVIYSWNEVAGF